MTVSFSESAKDDIDRIWDFSIKRWGERQTDKYMHQMENRFQWLDENPHLGRKRDEVKEGYLSYFQGEHTIFYRVTSDGIEILGIPRQTEDVIKHLEIDTPSQNLLSQQTETPFDEPDEKIKTPEQAKDDPEP